MRMTCKSTIRELHRAWPACCNEWPPVSRMSLSGCPQIDYASIPRKPNSYGWDHLDGFRTVPRTPKWAFWDLSCSSGQLGQRSRRAHQQRLNFVRLCQQSCHVVLLPYPTSRQLRIVRRTLTDEVAHSLVRALIHNQIDYCNGILASSPKYLTEKLQSVLRVAARLVLRLSPVARPFPHRCEINCTGWALSQEWSLSWLSWLTSRFTVWLRSNVM